MQRFLVCPPSSDITDVPWQHAKALVAHFACDDVVLTVRGYEYALLWWLLCLAIFFRGGGRYAVDRLIGKEFCCAERCPLSGVKRTSARLSEMSAFDPKRTLTGAKSPSRTRLFRCDYAMTMFVFDLNQIPDRCAHTNYQFRCLAKLQDFVVGRGLCDVFRESSHRGGENPNLAPPETYAHASPLARRRTPRCSGLGEGQNGRQR